MPATQPPTCPPSASPDHSEYFAPLAPLSAVERRRAREARRLSGEFRALALAAHSADSAHVRLIAVLEASS